MASGWTQYLANKRCLIFCDYFNFQIWYFLIYGANLFIKLIGFLKLILKFYFLADPV